MVQCEKKNSLLRIAKTASLIIFLCCSSFFFPGALLSSSGSIPPSVHRFGVDGLTLDLIQKIQEMGVYRSGMNGLSWQMLEPKEKDEMGHHYDPQVWERIRHGSRLLASLGHKVQANLLTRNEWAVETFDRDYIDPGDGKPMPMLKRIKPEHHEDYCNLIKRLLHESRDTIAAIQIGSEAENAWYSAEGYVEALKIAYQTIKEVAPEVEVWAGGFNMGPFFSLDEASQQKYLESPQGQKIQRKIDFVQSFLTSASPYFDKLTLHLPHGPETIAPTVEWFKNEMKKNHYQKPIWIDDMASGVRPLQCSPGDLPEWLQRMENGDEEAIKQFRKEQASNLVKKIVTAFASRVEGIYLSSDADWKHYFMPCWRWMGLMDHQGNPYPAFYSYQQAIQFLSDFTVSEPISEWAYGFWSTDEHPSVVVAWSEEDCYINLADLFPGPWVKITRLNDTWGKTIAESEITEASYIPIGPKPIYIEYYDPWRDKGTGVVTHFLRVQLFIFFNKSFPG